jgi:hypothetical protein
LESALKKHDIIDEQISDVFVLIDATLIGKDYGLVDVVFVNAKETVHSTVYPVVPHELVI